MCHRRLSSHGCRWWQMLSQLWHMQGCLTGAARRTAFGHYASCISWQLTSQQESCRAMPSAQHPGKEHGRCSRDCRKLLALG